MDEMERMEQTIKPIDQGYYGIKEVRLTRIRGELILTFKDLMDGSYQEREWIEKTEPKRGEVSFRDDFDFCIEMFDDQNMFQAIEKKKMPYDDIGWSLKNKKEAEALYDAAKPMDYLSDNCSYNKEFLESKELYDLREESEKAFAVFMENEKENEEFCKFMYEVIIEQKRASKEELGGKEGYEGIKEYIKVCNRRNKEIRESRGI
jgi:hypothetical protein